MAYVPASAYMQLQQLDSHLDQGQLAPLLLQVLPARLVLHQFPAALPEIKSWRLLRATALQSKVAQGKELPYHR